MSSMAGSGTIADIQVSVRQITQQSLVSRWYEMLARSSQFVIQRMSESTASQSDENASSFSSFSALAAFPRLRDPDKGL